MVKKNITSYDENGRNHGYREVYYEFYNNLKFKGCYIHGLEHGYCEVYWHNGQSNYKAHFINGLKHGYWETYFVDGSLFYKAYYYLGKKLHQTSENKLLL